jgi:hypothetical protein
VYWGWGIDGPGGPQNHFEDDADVARCIAEAGERLCICLGPKHTPQHIQGSYKMCGEETRPGALLTAHGVET